MSKRNVRNMPVHGDPVISILLDEILDLTGVDPEFVQPDSLLGKDLEMSDEHIAELAARLSSRFLPGGKLDHASWRHSTLRQIVANVQSLMYCGGWRAA